MMTGSATSDNSKHYDNMKFASKNDLNIVKIGNAHGDIGDGECC